MAFRAPGRRVGVTALALGVLACAREPAPLAADPPVVVAELRHSSRGGEHAVVTTRIRRQPVQLFVDTGASMNLVTAALAWYLGLPRHPTRSTLSDATHMAVPVLGIDGGLTLAGLGHLEVWAAHMPSLDEIGIAGVLAPQSLASRDRSVVLDLARGRLRVVAASSAPSHRHAVRARACTDAYHAVRYLVDARIDGRAATLLVDTGSPVTAVESSSAAGGALLAEHRGELTGSQLDEVLGRPARAGRASATTTSGLIGQLRVARLPRTSVDVGGVARVLEVQVDLIEPDDADGPCPSDGVLGFDYLAGRVLVLTDTSAYLLPGARAPRLREAGDPASLPGLYGGDIDVVGACPGAAMPALEMRRRHFDDPRMAWPVLSRALGELADEIEDACKSGGYLRAEVRADLRLAPHRRAVRGRITIRPGQRSRATRGRGAR